MCINNEIVKAHYEHYTAGTHSAIDQEQVLMLNEKVVRANFTILQSDLDQIAQVKKKCLLLGIETSKSELIRAAIDALAKLSDTKLRDTLGKLPKPKIGGKRSSKS